MELVDRFKAQAKASPRTIVYPEGTDERIVTAAALVARDGIARPVLVGEPDDIHGVAQREGVDLEGVATVSPRDEARLGAYAAVYAEERGLRPAIARKLVRKPLAFGGMMVRCGDADGMVAGVASATASVIQAASLTIGFAEGISTPSSFFLMIVPEYEGEKNRTFVFADCAVNISPDARQLAEIAVVSGGSAKALLGVDPRIAFLSFSTRGSADHEDVRKVTEAVSIAREMGCGFAMDGELQADTAISSRVAAKKAPDSELAGAANVLIFPDLDAGNICYKLVQYLTGGQAVGPILQGFARPVNDMSRGATVDDLVAVTAIAVIQAQGGGAG